MKRFPIHGAGLGFRRESMDELEIRVPDVIDFFEVAPENWIDMGGVLGRPLQSDIRLSAMACHFHWAARCRLMKCC